MSLRLEMLQAARLAPKLLGESASLVGEFLLRQASPEGGFQDRAGHSDLYYTVFGLDGVAALALQGPHVARIVARTREFLRAQGDGQHLDLVHRCCLARSWAGLATLDSSMGCGPEVEDLLRQIEKHRSADGGYHPVAGSAFGTVYGAFLGLGAYQDLNAHIPEPMHLVQSLAALQTPDGAWTNELARPVPSTTISGATNATSAACTLLRHCGAAIPPPVKPWLLARAHPQGGFLATPTAPMPDLLSTATALHALAGLEVPFASLKERCLDFLDSLWTNEGSFYGHWGDDHLDCEYTFYALLALGHLSS